MFLEELEYNMVPNSLVVSRFWPSIWFQMCVHRDKSFIAKYILKRTSNKFKKKKMS
jgi:hypothetical protein